MSSMTAANKVVAIFPATPSNGHSPKARGKGGIGSNGHKGQNELKERHFAGNASRFFYCAKANKSERGAGNDHPTVKPLRLMQYLIRLGSREGQCVLDPFSGSGSTDR